MPKQPHVPTGDELTALMDASATVLCLDIDTDWRPSVLANLEATLRLARLVADFALPDTAEPANIFRVPQLDQARSPDSDS